MQAFFCLKLTDLLNFFSRTYRDVESSRRQNKQPIKWFDTFFINPTILHVNLTKKHLIIVVALYKRVSRTHRTPYSYFRLFFIFAIYLQQIQITLLEYGRTSRIVHDIIFYGRRRKRLGSKRKSLKIAASTKWLRHRIDSWYDMLVRV